MKKLLAIILSVTMILGCAVLCTSAKFGDTITQSKGVINISDYESTTVLLANTTAVDDSDDSLENGCPMTKGSDPSGYPYFDGVREGDYYTFTANVNTSGSYKVALAFGWASWDLVGNFSIYVDGSKAASVINEVAGINFQEWTLTTEALINLESGEHEIKVVIDSYAINVSALCFAPENMSLELKYPTITSKAPVIPEENAALYPVDLTYGTGAYRFIANTSFDGFSIMLGTNGTVDGKCEISIFEYDTNYEKTLENEPIVTHLQDPVVNNALVDVEIGQTLPAGEYLIYIDATILDDQELLVYAYMLLESFPEGFMYVDGEIWADIVPTIIINFTQELDSGIYFGQCEMGEDTPEDYYPEDEDTGDDSDVDGTADPEVDGTAAPEVDDTVAVGTDEEETAAGTGVAGTAAETGAAGTVAGTGAAGTTAAGTTAVAAKGCKAVVGSMSVIVLVATAAAAAVVLKKKEN